jgi:hypothetical protein
LRVQSATSETSSKARKRNKNKTSSSTQNENNVNNPITTRAPPVTHPKSTPKDELQPNKQQAKVQVKSSQVSNKQALPVSSSTTKKTTQSIQDQQQEQPFTVVGGNRHKTGTPPLQQQQQQNKPVRIEIMITIYVLLIFNIFH